MIISGEYDYSDPQIQAQVANLTSSLEATRYISPGIYTESWLQSFLHWFEDNREFTNATIDNEKSFVDAVRDEWLYPTSTFALDIKFDDKQEHIVASRFLIQAVNVSGTNQEKDMVKLLRQICADSPLNASVFHPYFVFFDQFELVLPTSIQSMILGAICMMVISFIFIPNVLCCFWVAFCIVSIEIGVAGYMSLWDVSLDSISMINLIMCIGFSVDFTAHICYAYMSSKKRRPDQRVEECLYTLGLPIVQGALSTILGLVALVLADTYIFLIFFKMVFLVISIGAIHGLMLLPVLLSLFGPGSCTNFSKEDDDDDKNNALQQPYVIPHPTLLYPSSPAKEKTSALSLTVLPEDRDPGIGTSEDSNSTESGSSQSRRKQHEAEQPVNSQPARCNDWRHSLGLLQGLSQFQAPPPDYPGATGTVTSVQPSQPVHEHRRSRSHHIVRQTPARYFSELGYS